ncbi:MAG: hypothetical protein RLZZ63_1024 [Gemmatimonadota bacterium]
MSRFPRLLPCWSGPSQGARFAGVIALLIGVAGTVEAQVFRGTVRSSTTTIPIPEAQVTVRDSLDDVLASTVSDATGRFTLRLRRVPTGSVIVQARRLGYEVVRTGEARIGRGDSVEVELLMTEVAATLDAITVGGMATLNEKRLADAYRRGWQVYEPERVAQHQSRAADMMQLLRSMGTPSLILPRRIDDCVRNTRTGECVTWVLDGQIVGPSAFILPTDVYFFAVLSPSEARVEYGNRAPNGAISVYTRSATDRPTRRP